MTFWLCDISTGPVSHSSLMNVLESWPAEACVISPSFYHEEAARLSCGIRSTLCRDRQTLSANKMECLCISHLSVNIQMTPSVCVRARTRLWHAKDCVSAIIHLGGVDGNSTGPPDPLVLAARPPPLTSYTALAGGSVTAGGIISSCQGGGPVPWRRYVGRWTLISPTNRPYALFNCVGGVWAKGKAREKNAIASLLASIWGVRASQSHCFHAHLFSKAAIVLRGRRRA